MLIFTRMVMIAVFCLAFYCVISSIQFRSELGESINKAISLRLEKKKQQRDDYCRKLREGKK